MSSTYQALCIHCILYKVTFNLVDDQNYLITCVGVPSEKPRHTKNTRLPLEETISDIIDISVRAVLPFKVSRCLLSFFFQFGRCSNYLMTCVGVGSVKPHTTAVLWSRLISDIIDIYQFTQFCPSRCQ